MLPNVPNSIELPLCHSLVRLSRCAVPQMAGRGSEHTSTNLCHKVAKAQSGARRKTLASWRLRGQNKKETWGNE